VHRAQPPADELAELVHRALPPKAKNLLNLPGLCIAGGFVRDVLNKDDWKDIDFFVVDSSAVKFEDLVTAFGVNLSGWGLYESKYAITYSNHSDKSLQLIKGSHSCVQALLKRFDFSCCKMAIYVEGMNEIKFESIPGAYKDAKRKMLFYTGNGDPGSSICRMLKFKRRGYTISEEESNKVLTDFETSHHMSQYVLTDVEEREDAFPAPRIT